MISQRTNVDKNSPALRSGSATLDNANQGGGSRRETENRIFVWPKAGKKKNKKYPLN